MTDDELLQRADAIASRAYAPYSSFYVGAAVLARNGRVFEGVNVESASYPLGFCAERVALSRAATDGLQPGDVEAIAISSATSSNLLTPVTSAATSTTNANRKWIRMFRCVRRT